MYTTKISTFCSRPPVWGYGYAIFDSLHLDEMDDIEILAFYRGRGMPWPGCCWCIWCGMPGPPWCCCCCCCCMWGLGPP